MLGLSVTQVVSESPSLSRIALGIEYDGAAFHGWQRQADPHLPTVQASVEAALSKVANHPISLICAGRTDTGVHATAQVVHFDCEIDRGERAWIKGCNSMMPRGVRVTWAKTVDSEFHARFTATARRYNYIIYDAPVAPAVMAQQLTHTRLSLSVEMMHEAGQYLLGENDFSSFRAAGCQSRSPFRNVMHLNVTQHHRFIVIDIRANAFLQHMVRNIAGVLLEIGAGRRPPVWAKEVLALRDRTQSAMTASPNGLYLVDVTYPQSCGLPNWPIGPSFLQPFT